MTLLNNALSSTAHRLNEHLLNTFPSPDPWVICCNLSRPDGTPEAGTENKIVATLLGLTPQTTVANYNPTHGSGDGYTPVQPPLFLNAFILFTANFAGARYLDGLNMLSRTIGFFQANPVFSAQNLPGLDPGIDKLTFEMEHLSFEDQSTVMAAQKALYLPSVAYKLRGMVFQSDGLVAEIPAIS